MQKDKDRRGCGIDRYYSITANGRRKYLGNSPSRIAALLTGLWYLVGGLTCGRYFLSARGTDQNLFAYVTTAIYAVGGLLPGMWTYRLWEKSRPAIVHTAIDPAASG